MASVKVKAAEPSSESHEEVSQQTDPLDIKAECKVLASVRQEEAEPCSQTSEEVSQQINRHTVKPGFAPVKAEFIDKHHEKKLVTDYMPENMAKELQAALGPKRGSEREEGPPNKKIKIKGRSKKRPIIKHPPASEKLCPQLAREKVCSWGDKCKFNHDVVSYLANKPKDVFDRCYVFDKFGKCPFSLTCRFAKCHITDEGKNIINEDLFSQSQKKNTVVNTLSKELQLKLRKKQYDFEKANKTVKAIEGMLQRKRTVRTSSGSKVPASNEAIPSADASASIHSPDSLSVMDTVQPASSSVEAIQPGAASLESVTPSVIESTNVTGHANTSAEIVGSESCVPHKQACDSPDTETVNAAVNGLCYEDHTFVSSTSDSTAVSVHPEDKMLMQRDAVALGDDLIRLRIQEKKKVNFEDKLYLAPLTTVGNLPFRRICKSLGADITCGEMALSTNLLQGQLSEWALLKRHSSEDLFGVQICGSYADTMTRCAQILTETCDLDFIDINCGCPIDLIFKKGEGSALMGRPGKMEQIVRSMTTVMDIPLTLKMRTGIYEDKSIAHNLVPKLKDWGLSALTVHGRSREQRYTKLADWEYLQQCAQLASPMPFFGNGDVLSYEDYNLHKTIPGVTGIMFARGALIKPWLFTEIKEQRHWDISATERLDMLKDFVSYGLEHWGSDDQGVSTTRRFLLEWLSFLHRYIPVGVLEHLPQKINEKPPYYFGRTELETLLSSPSYTDWIKISEMLLGPVPEGFTFMPKHKANAYQ